jgi:hypothetical protein
MARPRYQLTPALQQEILAYVRTGGYPHVAAEAAGVPRHVFERWLTRGAFARVVRQAHAQARLRAELAILADKPLDWLKAGPGKETADGPGWTNPAKPRAADDEGREAQLLAEVLDLFQRCVQLLAPFPEARAAVAPLVEQLRQTARRAER